MAFFTEKELSNGLTELFTKENSKIMKSRDKAVTNGLTSHGMKALLKMDLEMELENTLILKRKLNTRVNGWME